MKTTLIIWFYTGTTEIHEITTHSSREAAADYLSYGWASTVTPNLHENVEIRSVK